MYVKSRNLFSKIVKRAHFKRLFLFIINTLNLSQAEGLAIFIFTGIHFFNVNYRTKTRCLTQVSYDSHQDADNLKMVARKAVSTL